MAEKKPGGTFSKKADKTVEKDELTTSQKAHLDRMEKAEA